MALRRQQAQEENEARDLSKQFKVDQLVRELQEKNGLTYMAALQFVTTSAGGGNDDGDVQVVSGGESAPPPEVINVGTVRSKPSPRSGDELRAGSGAADTCSSADELDVGDNDRTMLNDVEDEYKATNFEQDRPYFLAAVSAEERCSKGGADVSPRQRSATQDDSLFGCMGSQLSASSRAGK